MQSGLRSYFSRPAKTNGATPKRMRGFQTPTGNFAEFPSPAVSDRTFRSGFFRTPKPYISRYPQVRSSRYATRPASPVSLSTSSIGTGGGHRSSAVNRNLNLTENEELFPVPCHTLQTRLALSAAEVEATRTKEPDMKTVNKTPSEFKMRFSGKPVEDWIGHVDALETHRALKYSWTAKQFYYGLLHTLTDEAHKTAAAMEDDTEEMEMHRAFSPIGLSRMWANTGKWRVGK